MKLSVLNECHFGTLCFTPLEFDFLFQKAETITQRIFMSIDDGKLLIRRASHAEAGFCYKMSTGNTLSKALYVRFNITRLPKSFSRLGWQPMKMTFLPTQENYIKGVPVLEVSIADMRAAFDLSSGAEIRQRRKREPLYNPGEHPPGPVKFIPPLPRGMAGVYSRSLRPPQWISSSRCGRQRIFSWRSSKKFLVRH